MEKNQDTVVDKPLDEEPMGLRSCLWYLRHGNMADEFVVRALEALTERVEAIERAVGVGTTRG